MQGEGVDAVLGDDVPTGVDQGSPETAVAVPSDFFPTHRQGVSS
jgi:hypothetical protein